MMMMMSKMHRRMRRTMTTVARAAPQLQQQLLLRQLLLYGILLLLLTESSSFYHGVVVVVNSFVLQPPQSSLLGNGAGGAVARTSSFFHHIVLSPRENPHNDHLVVFHCSSSSASSKMSMAPSNSDDSINTAIVEDTDTNTQGNNHTTDVGNNATTTTVLSSSSSNTTATTNATTITTNTNTSTTTSPSKKQPSLLFANRLRNSYLENLLLVNTTRPIRYEDSSLTTTTTTSSWTNSINNKKSGGGKNNDANAEIKILVVRPPMLHDVFPNLVGSTQDTDEFDLYEYLHDAGGSSSIGNDASRGDGGSDDTENNTTSSAASSSSAASVATAGSWAVIFMHPGDFTPVCTTELGQAALMQAEFERRNVKLVGFSCNDANAHRKWLEDVYIVTGGRVSFPIFCDDNRQMATRLGILDPTNADANSGLPLTVRSVYILKPDKTIALIMTYPASTGRNMKELLRCIDAVQLTHVSQVATPVNWKRGDECLVDLSLNDEEADQVFGVDGYRIIKVPSEVGLGTRLPRHYMRYTKDPSAGFVRRMIQRMLQRPKPPKQ